MTGREASRWVIRAGTPSRAELIAIDHHRRVALLKSFGHTAWWFRWTAGCVLTRREAAAYVALDGIRGVPRLLERRGPTAFVMELVNGRSCFACRTDDFDEGFFERLIQLLEQIRSRGVLHGDIKRNVVRGEDGCPWLVDFGASFVLLRHLPGIRTPVIRLAARYDMRAVSKLKSLVAPHLLTDVDLQRMEEPLPFEAIVKRGEAFVRRATRVFTTPS